MTEDEDLLNVAIPGYVSTRKAAQMLSVSYDRVYQYIQEQRLSTKQVGHMLMVPIAEIERFKRYPSGRVRKQPPPWRAYRSGIELKGRELHVRIRAGREVDFEKKWQAMRQGQDHLLNGTMLRYILVNEQKPTLVHIWLAWKDNEADEEELERELAAFKSNFADVLDWETMQEEPLKGLLYT